MNRPTFRDVSDHYTDAELLPAMPTEVKHEGATGLWIITFDPPPIPCWHEMAWQFCHDDFDGAPDGNDRRYGHASSVEDAIEQIEEMEAGVEYDDGGLQFHTETGEQA